MAAGTHDGPILEHLRGREVPLGGVRSLLVRRSLPQRDRRSVGAWCFVDHYGPTPAAPGRVMDVPPHPHTGLQTVTWLVSGQVRHDDSLGSAVEVRPGELNLMTAGHGIAHSEVSVGAAALLGVQLWVALPEAHRHQAPHFEHHVDLPLVRQDGAQVRVAVGSYDGAASPAATYSPLLALEMELDRTAVLVLREDFEHAVLLVAGAAEADGEPLQVGSLLYLGTGRSALALAGDRGSRLLVIGGEPFEDELVMWWNFVGRSHEEIATARAQWESADPRFGAVTGYRGDRLPAPALPGVPLKPRPRVRR